eukprot:366074-Chlamydomonas_euryale.AAC.16
MYAWVWVWVWVARTSRGMCVSQQSWMLVQTSNGPCATTTPPDNVLEKSSPEVAEGWASAILMFNRVSVKISARMMCCGGTMAGVPRFCSLDQESLKTACGETW